MSETTELRVPDVHSLNDPAVAPEQKPDDAVTLVRGDPHAEARARIAERYEEQRQRQIAEQAGEAPEPPPIDDAERGERWDRGTVPNLQPSQHELRREAEQADREALEQHAEQPGPPAAPQQPQQPAQPAPQLIPLHLPNGTTYVTADQAAYLMQQGAASLTRTQQQQWQQPSQQPQPSQPAQPQRDFIAEIDHALQFGDEPTRRQALAALHQHATNNAAQQAMQQMTTNNNLAIVAAEHPDIFGSVTLAQLAALKLHEMRGHPLFAQQPELWQYRAACGEVRRALGAGNGYAAPQPQQQPAFANGNGQARANNPDRLERKRNAPSAPRATDRRFEVEGGPREPTRSEVVAWMRQKRGQAV